MVRLVIVILVLLIIRSACKSIAVYVTAYKKKIDIMEFNSVLNANYDNTSLNVVDEIIADAVTRYRIYNIEMKRIPYITESIQSDMIRGVLEDVLTNIPKVLSNKLVAIYGKEYMEDAILQKVQTHVIEYTVQVNSNSNER